MSRLTPGGSDLAQWQQGPLAPAVPVRDGERCRMDVHAKMHEMKEGTSPGGLAPSHRRALGIPGLDGEPLSARRPNLDGLDWLSVWRSVHVRRGPLVAEPTGGVGRRRLPGRRVLEGAVVPFSVVVLFFVLTLRSLTRYGRSSHPVGSARRHSPAPPALPCQDKGWRTVISGTGRPVSLTWGSCTSPSPWHSWRCWSRTRSTPPLSKRARPSTCPGCGFLR